MVGGEDDGQVRRPERPRLAPAATAGGSPVAGEDPGRSFLGRGRLAGEAGPGSTRPRPLLRRSPAPGPSLVVELGEVRAESGVLERPAAEPSVEAAQSTPGRCSG